MRPWTQDELDAVRAAYEAAGSDGSVGLISLAERIGRPKTQICVKARRMGLTNITRRKGPEKPDARMFKGDAKALRLFMSEKQKRRIEENGHPRGMAGKKHSQETREAISESSRAMWASWTPEQISENTMKRMKARAGPPQVSRGTWNAGWRVIGGVRKYYRSRWEANYARYLQWLKDRGEIADWQHEPKTFWFEQIKRGVRSYKPDFQVWENSGSHSFHEVKGWMCDRSKTTLSRMAKYYPEEKVIVIDGKAYRAIRLQMMRLIQEWEDHERDSRA